MRSKNYSVLKMLVLEEVLSNYTTIEMSKILGFNFDKCKRWLTNEKILKWDEFKILCEKTGLDLAAALETIKFPNNNFLSDESFFSYLKKYNVFETNQEVADYLKCHISVVKRYSKGVTVPDVDTIFKLIDFRSNLLSLFLSRLFSNKINNPLLQTWIDEGAKSAYFEANLPLSSMIEAALNIEHYKERSVSTDVWLADLLSLKLEDIQNALKSMIASHILTRDEKSDVYSSNNDTTNLDGVGNQDIIPFIQFLNLKVVKLLDLKKDKNYHSTAVPGAMVSRVFPASKESIDEINYILIKANTEILKVLEKDPHPKIEARVILLQHFGITK